MSEELLREIKEEVMQSKVDFWVDETIQIISLDQIEKLIDYAEKQAERVQELEKENKWIRQMKYHEAYEQGKFDTNMKVWYEIPKLEKQNKRYREALEFYAEQDNYGWEISYRPQQEIDCMVIDDGGHTARKALGVSQNE